MPALAGPAIEQPWWWARVVALEKRIQSIREAYDPEGLVAPKEYWATNREAELEGWFKDRRESHQPQPLSPLR